jgi:hypothetical protein
VGPAPTVPGEYPICAVGGGTTSQTFLVVDLDGRLFYPIPWGGWFWSEPSPGLPKVPEDGR